MRALFLAFGLILAAGAAAAFEVEDRKLYPAAQPRATLTILSTADINVFEPILTAFQALNPGLAIDYTVASSTQVMRAISLGEARFDLVISSAMDLQTKLANDGFARRYSSEATQGLPPWATWRDRVFAFTQEPAVLVLSEAIFADHPIPATRTDLIALLRDAPQVFRGRIGTYDVRSSGFGYLIATQDSRNTEAFWRLTEVMGRLDTRLYCCSGEMISDVASGRLALAYNVLGSYAQTRLKDTAGLRIVPLQDYTSVMLRTALIPMTAQNPDEATRMIDFLVTLKTRPDLTALTGLPPVDADQLNAGATIRPIPLGPGLLVFLDRMRRETFLRSWVGSIVQN